MLSKMHTPESCCIEPEHFRDYFRAFYWTSQRSEKRCRKRIGKRDRRRARPCAAGGGGAPALLANPSRFAAFACARAAVLARWTRAAAVASDRSDDSDSEDHSPLVPPPCAKLPKITGIGLRTVFALVAQARTVNAAFCELALKAMLDVLQGHAPEELHQEPCEIIQSLHNMLAEVSGGAVASSSVVTNSGGLSNSPGTSNCGGTIISGGTVNSGAMNISGGMNSSGGTINSAGISNRGATYSSVGISNIGAISTSLVPGGGGSTAASALTAVASSCLVALAVARGDAELLLSAAACLLVSPPHLADQRVTVPANLVTLQRSVQAALLGSCARNSWLNYGVPAHSLFTSFTIELPEEVAGAGSAGGAGGACRALASDGSYLYAHTPRGLLKLGSGYGGTVRAHLYRHRADFFPGERHSWLGCCKNKLYVRMGRKKSDIYQVDKDTLEIDGVLRLDPGPGPAADSKAFIFTDGTNLGMISVASQDVLSVKLYGAAGASPAPLAPHRELTLRLLRRRTLALGAPPYEELRRRALDAPDAPHAPHAALIDDTDEERAMSVAAGQDFALLRTASGKVYYTGKAASLGYKVPNPPSGKWCLMRETQYSRNDPQNAVMSRIVQVALGHEGVHAVLVAEDGGALFVGTARRGEDGDFNRHRRQPKPSKPKKMAKVEAYQIAYAACNYGSTALVTRQGALLMFGKDTQHCDTLGVVGGLRHERIVQVALGKAHAVALTATGLVYTFGINNRGQCGRELGYTKEKHGHRGTSANHNAPPLNHNAPPLNHNAAPLNHNTAPLNHNAPRVCAPSDHLFELELCRVCVLCHECTGFSTGCRCAEQSHRAPREICGCGQGDSGCGVCGVCRRCAGCYEPEDDELPPSADGHNAREGHKYEMYECDARSGCGDGERESPKVTCLPPARIAVPGGHKIAQVACGLHHTVLLTDHGEVMTFGANQMGQLGAGNLSAHHRIVRVRVPRAAAVAAGSNHTVVRTRDGELYTFGNYQGGALGRERPDDTGGGARARDPLWHATPGKVTRLGPGSATRAVWSTASGDQTFVQVSQTLLKPDTLYTSTITANKNTIVILPTRSECTFKCITINKVDGSCKSHAGPEQVDFGGALACLDPLYDVMWCYRPHARLFHCYNILAFDTHTLQRCSRRERHDDAQYPNYGPMKRLEEFKNLETIESVCTDEDHRTDGAELLSMSILNQELAVPCVGSSQVTRMHAAMHLLGCTDTLTFAQDCKLSLVRCKCDYPSAAGAGSKEDFLVVNRFESHGGGWGYSGHSVEAIRFMVDTDLLLGGFGLFGGRGDYTAKIKLLDLGVEGGEHEGEGELLAESDEIVFECPPREKFPVLFDLPVPLVPNRWYVAWATINGPSSDCGSSGQMMVVTDDAVFHFKTSKKSNNGTDVNAGQIPCLLYSTASADQSSLVTRCDHADSYIVLSKKISRKITTGCFRSLITLLQWAWTSLRKTLMDTSGSVPPSHKKLQQMKHQRRLTYIVGACTRILKCYINEERKRTSNHLMYSDVISEVRSLLQSVMAEAAPTCWTASSKKAGRGRVAKLCTVTFQLELTDAALQECHRTILSCFDAFFPTPAAKWAHLCSLLHHVKEGIVPASKVRELTATVAALCVSKSLREILHYVVPISQNYSLTDGHQSDETLASKSVRMETPTRSKASGSKPPPVPPRANSKDAQSQRHQQHDITEARPPAEWGLTDALPRLLDATLAPARAASPAGHDHGERALAERLAAAAGGLLARLVAELAYSSESREEGEVREATGACLATPSRFMRANTSRSWNTGNGSPDAIGFTVDRSGVMLVGAGVYGGLANHDYELELLHDVRSLQPMRAATEESNPAHCWFSVDVTHGTYTPADCHNDIAQLKFNRPIPLKEGVRYALRFCNHGGRTSNGDCGLPSVKGPDGTTFRFSSCSLSFNGTTLARGQLPTVLYCRSAAAANESSSENKDVIESAIRSTTLKVASLIVDRTVELFRNLRNEVSPEELPARAQLLQRSPAVSVLVPYTLANLRGLNDPKSVVARLEMVRRLLPEVAAVRLAGASAGRRAPPPPTTSPYYAWVESDHPYGRQATVSNTRVLFPARVAWVLLEVDPASSTAQPEDTLTVYAAAGGGRHHCHCAPRLPAHAARKGIQQKSLQLDSDEMGICERTADDSLCLEYDSTYVAVTPKMSNSISEWPQKALLIPGNEVIFSLETATDYLNEFKGNGEESRFGFRALCVGYEASPAAAGEPALSELEMELAYAGAACAAELLSPELDIPPLGPASALELRHVRGAGEARAPAHAQTRALWEQHEAALLARGLELSDPPTVQHVLTGQPLSQCQSTERLFLADLVSGAPRTAGGRLAAWLQPSARVEPARCDVRLPGAGGAAPRVGAPLLIAVSPRDQRGDLVRSPALKVEVVVQLSEAGAGGAARAPPDCRTFGGRAPPPVHAVPYAPVARDNVLFHAITIMKAYVHYSFEELRAASRGGGARVPPERLPVRPQLAGGYVASWVPRAAGLYRVECTLDDASVRQDLTVEVKEQISAGLPSTSAAPTIQASDRPLPTRPTKLRKFCASETAGLRVRAHPSLQSEEIGVIPPDANIAFTEEVQNNDGTWLRLSPEAVRLFVEGGGSSAVAVTALAADPPHAWCLQYHRQLERTLLEPLEAQLFTGKTDDLEPRSKQLHHIISPSNSHSEQDSENDNEESEDSILFSSLRLRKGFNFRANSESDSDVNIFNFTKKHAAQPSESMSDSKARTFVFGPKEVEEDEKSIEMLSPKCKSPGELLSRHMVCHSKNGNGCSDWDELPSPEEDDDEFTTSNVDNQQEGRLTQTGTQTSPDKYEHSETFSVGSSSKEETPRRPERRQAQRAAGAGRAAPQRPPPRPYALSPSQAECYRALFAALLWHEGIVHDAMACAAFLKFHPQLPKEGFKVVTRTASAGSDVGAASRALKQQRHSVEVSNAGQYLHIQPSTLESLTRSANNASANRSRGKRVDAAGPPISEEETLGSGPQVVTLPAPTTVNVLPPALRALVALWDTLSDARELGVNPEKYMKEDELEKLMCGVDRKLYNFNSRTKAKKEYRVTSSSEALYTVCCELCDGLAVAPPLAAHMGLAHPGCRAPCCKGYDRLGCYVDAGPSLTPCGQLAQEYSNGAYFNSSHAKAGYYLWYMYCERCRDKSIKASAGQPKPRPLGDRSLEMLPPTSTALLDHYEILENATFLLELAPATSSGSGGIIAGSPPTPASSPWVPAPPFQSLDSLGANPFLEEELTEQNQEALIREWEENGMGRVYHELIEGYGIDQLGQIPGLLHPTHAQRFHRSVSMGQAGCARDLASEGRALFMRHHEINIADTSGSSASLLATPSAALQRLVGSGRPASNRGTADNLCAISAFETPTLDRAALLGRPVLTFVRGKRDLHVVRQRMDAAVRISTVRQYALEALNWLLRSVTQPVSLHDIMWWFCSALEQFGKYDCTNDNIRRNLGAAEGACAATESRAVAGGGGGGRAALHALLQSVAELMPSLPPTCAPLLQAVRCWALHFSSADHALLHRVISKILSHTEEDLYEESVVGLMPDENESITSKEGFTWHCRDVTAWCAVSVSSRAAAAAALTDGTTDTFWESGDEERTEPKWIQVTCPSGVLDEKPHIICLHIDNTRDTANKTLMVTFLYSGNSTDLFQMQEVEVDVKSATWVQYTLPRNAIPPLRIRCELRGPDPTVRVRQVKVLALPSLRPGPAAAAASASHYKSALERAQPAALILHQTIEQETLRVFRLITSQVKATCHGAQVFGKLLEWGSGSGGDGEGAASPGGDADADAAESELRERLVGILFSGSKMTSLQKQVMSHVVSAVGVEARRARDEWESAAAAAAGEARDGTPASPDTPDTASLHNYCFEMLSLLLALSGSQVGLEHLARRLELLPDLMSLLHTGSDRSQRQVISLLQRLIGEISPPKMLSALNPGNDGTVLRVSLVDHLATYVCKAISVQVKAKGAGAGAGAGAAGAGSPRAPAAATAGGSVAPPPPGFWFMRGQTSKKLAQLVVRLLRDMAEERVSAAWGAETRAALARYTVRLAGVPDAERRPGRCVAGAPMWLALAALCVIEESYTELIAPALRAESGDARARRASDARESRPYCANHDDGETLAVVDCRSCGPLCHECDRCLHLNRAARTHHRQICKEEESTIRVDIHEGCGRAKLFWLLLLVDRRTLKALAEFRGSAQPPPEEAAALPGPPGLAGVCRFCGAHGSSGLLAIGNVCADQECQDHSRWACARVLACGHLCGGARGERRCLPCLYGCEAAPALRQDADDMCMICFTEPLAAAPALQLKCGHVFHLHCCKKVLGNKWNGPRITFSFSQCPICKEDMEHEMLEELLAPLRRLQEEVRRKALMRLEYEGLPAAPSARPRADLAAYAMERYAYYVCFKCDKAYFGGLARCDAESSARYDPAELVCGACSDVTGARTCAKHGADFLEYKCRYCCSLRKIDVNCKHAILDQVAVFFCFGTSHFCNTCHDDFQRVTNIAKHALPQCPAGPKARQLEGTSDDCPLHMQHPPTGEEFALGCGVCRNSQNF